MTNPANPVILSLLDTDLYKFTMWQPLLHIAPGNHAQYRFVCRNLPQYPLAQLKDEVQEQLDHLCTLRFTEEELAYLATKSYIKPDFIEFLRIFQFQNRFLRVNTNGDSLEVIAEGPQIHVMGFEIYVLSIINELYFRRLESPETLVEARARLQQKI